jgi:hypothetical protein
MAETIINSVRKVKPIKLFDILVDDIHSMGPESEAHVLPGLTDALTFHEVLEHLAQGGDWYFRVTEHNNPEVVFMSGCTYDSMRNAYDGELTGYLGEVDSDDYSKICEITHAARAKQVAVETAALKRKQSADAP